VNIDLCYSLYLVTKVIIDKTARHQLQPLHCQLTSYLQIEKLQVKKVTKSFNIVMLLSDPEIL